MTDEFKNLLELLNSPNKENVTLGLQIAQNYKREIEDYFGITLRDMNWLFDVWNECLTNHFNLPLWHYPEKEEDFRAKGYWVYVSTVIKSPMYDYSQIYPLLLKLK